MVTQLIVTHFFSFFHSLTQTHTHTHRVNRFFSSVAMVITVVDLDHLAPK